MQYTVAMLLQRAMADHQKSSTPDLFLQYLEEAYERIRSMPWSWNWSLRESTTLSPVTLVEQYNFTNGSAVISSALPTSALPEYTGRVIQIDEQLYRVVAVGYPTANDITLDRKYVGASSLLNTVVLYRNDLAVKTNGIKRVELDSIQIQFFSDEQVERDTRNVYRYVSADTCPTSYYIDRSDSRIAAPKFRPYLVDTGAGTGPDAGEHSYFFVYEDAESGEQSKPGPILTTTMSGKAYIAYYRSIAGNFGENSYRLVLYGNEKAGVPEYTRRPFYRLGVKESLNIASTISLGSNSVDSVIYAEDRYYGNRYCRIIFTDLPDDVYRVSVLCVNTHGVGLSLSDILQVGENQDVIRAFNAHMIAFNNKDTEKAIFTIASFEKFLKNQLGEETWQDHDPHYGGLVTPDPIVREDVSWSPRYPSKYY